MGFFTGKSKIVIDKLMAENEDLKRDLDQAEQAVSAALLEVESTQELIGDFIDRLDSIMEAVEKKNGDD